MKNVSGIVDSIMNGNNIDHIADSILRGFDKRASYEEDQIVPEGISSSTYNKSSDRDRSFELEANIPYQNGLFSVSRTYAGLISPMAKYVMAKILNDNPPRMATAADLSGRIDFLDIPTDFDKTALGINKAAAIYDDIIITAIEHYGDMIITARGKDRKIAKDWMDNFEHQLKTANQFVGKCLFFDSGNLRFKEVPDTQWEDVVISAKLQKDIRMNTLSFLADKSLHAAGVMSRKIIMHGPPGTGKTSVVKSVFRELQDSKEKVSRIFVTPESFKYSSVGDLFDVLNYLGPTVLAFEDIDTSTGSKRVEASASENRFLGDLLTNLDGMRVNNNPLVVLATTNRMELMDEALANRPGRFDRKVPIGLPTEEHLKIMYSKFLGSTVDDELVRMSNNFTGSHVRETVNTARILASESKRLAKDCMHEACGIIRDNFFPVAGNKESSKMQVKAAIQSRLMIKHG